MATIYSNSGKYGSGNKTDVVRPHERIPDGRPSLETRNFHPDDQRLRHHGFAIVSRPKVGPNLWGLGRNTHGEPVDVMKEADAAILCAALELELDGKKK